MAAISELDLPVLDYGDPELRGDRYRETIDALAAESWAARSELGWIFILDRTAADEILRSREVVFPAVAVAEAFGISEGPLAEAIRKNLISIEGDDHRRLRNLVNPAFSAREAARYSGPMVLVSLSL